VKKLINSGANVNAQDKDGNTALFSAINGNRGSVVMILLDSGADTKIQNNQKQAPKEYAHIHQFETSSL